MSSIKWMFMSYPKSYTMIRAPTFKPSSKAVWVRGFQSNQVFAWKLPLCRPKFNAYFMLVNPFFRATRHHHTSILPNHKVCSTVRESFTQQLLNLICVIMFGVTPNRQPSNTHECALTQGKHTSYPYTVSRFIPWAIHCFMHTGTVQLY